MHPPIPFIITILLPFATASFLPAPLPPASLPPIPSQLSAAAAAASSLAAITNAEEAQVQAQNALGISTGTPNTSLPDPCGPPSQTAITTTTSSSKESSESPSTWTPGSSTCHANLSTTSPLGSPSAYSVTCAHNATSATSTSTTTDSPAKITTCDNAMISICYTIAGFYGTPPRDEWVYNNQGGNCTLGFWLPKGGAPPPSYARCVDEIYENLVGTCADGAGGISADGKSEVGVGAGQGYDVGSVNLVEVPWKNVFEGKRGETGQAVDPGYPSYVMVGMTGKG